MSVSDGGRSQGEKNRKREGKRKGKRRKKGDDMEPPQAAAAAGSPGTTSGSFLVLHTHNSIDLPVLL